MAIQLFNTMTGKKEPLQTLEPGKVRFYACGPTVYNYFHVGNGRMFVVFDTIRRYLEYRGYEVKYVQNFTDVDDRIINRSQELGVDVRTVANMYIDAYFEDADALFIRRANVHPRVTETMDDIIAFIQRLIEKGHAYQRGGDVYFDTSSFPEYGKLSGQSPEDMRAGFRIEVNDVKDDPTDFALWKAAKPGEEYWESPFGPGRPGWHIECSVMIQKHLGEQIDIHAGGRDLVFPHHENEIAQSESYSDKTFARHWLHNGTLNINGEKMSKSLGNFIMTRDLLEKRPARAIRMFLLSAQYRHPLNYTEDAMDQAEQMVQRIDRSLRNLEHRSSTIQAAGGHVLEANDVQEVTAEAARVREAFIKAMDDDFNTADGITAVLEAVKEANTYLTRQQVSTGGIKLWTSLVVELTEVLGVAPDKEPEMQDALSDEQVEALLADRTEARKRRDFARSDEIRDQLQESGIVIEDTAQGTRWYRV